MPLVALRWVLAGSWEKREARVVWGDRSGPVHQWPAVDEQKLSVYTGRPGAESDLGPQHSERIVSPG